jgi:GT2 family glycosyltransferase
MASSGPRYAVVVATRNRGAKIEPLLASLRRSEESAIEVVIVDQSTNDDTRRAVEPFLSDSRFRYVHSTVAGTSRARNRGFALTHAPIIAITDDDCIVPPDWLMRLAKPFHDHPQVGVVYCNVDAVPVDQPGHTPNIHFAANRTILGMEMIHAGQPLWMGAGMAVRRSMLADIHGFDEQLGPGAPAFEACEDNDIAWRALVRGWWLYENAEVAVVHDGFRSLEQLRAHVQRDYYGIGGTVAKFVKTGHWRVGALLIALIYRSGVTEPLEDVRRGRFPRGFRRPLMLLQGLVSGLRTPLDPVTLLYRPDAERSER